MGIVTSRPLVLVDVDEVLGLFMQGFADYLSLQGLEFRLERFALFQNIYRPGEAEHLDVSLGKAHFDDFFRHASGEMAVADGARDALHRLSKSANIVILTNAPSHGRLSRARWLGRHRLDYPLILNTGPKGPLAAALARQVTGPVAFVDDMLSNLDSVAEHAPDIARFQTVADPRLRPMAPAKPDIHRRIDHWDALHPAIKAAIS
ncbi:MAG: hypothetical protein CGW95_00465 [Phenylobacterium zucineum]|nr:MAG: hypothetical protein CGW95_00465 [Phenylobacterium zucineum]